MYVYMYELIDIVSQKTTSQALYKCTYALIIMLFQYFNNMNIVIYVSSGSCVHQQFS